MSASGQERVIVVGAGIAGLAAAFRLKQAGHTVLVLEAAPEVGGRMPTITQGAYRIDLGAEILSESYRQMRQLVSDAGLDHLAQPTPDLLGIVRDGRIHRMRTRSYTGLARTGLLSLRSKAKAVALFRDLRRAGHLLDWGDLSGAAVLDIESVEAYAQRRLNRELLDYLAAPVCAAFFLRAPPELSVVGLFIAVHSLLGKSTFNFDAGIATLPQKLAEQLPVETNARVTHVEETGATVSVHWQRAGEPEHTEQAAAVVLAVPGHTVPDLFPQLPSAQREYLCNLRYAHDLHVHFGLTQPPAEQAAFILVPRREHPDLAIIVFDHTYAPGRAPKERGLMTLYHTATWSQQHWDLHDERVRASALASLHATLPHIAAHIETHQEMAYVQRWDRAILTRRAGEYHALAEFTRSLGPHSRVQLAGDYFAVTTTNSSLTSGERAAQAVARVLEGRY
ncbi:protoporphyrinogen/coproporphyrinogen oxidase [Streptomyces syringium]|uniref:protoporphyrinogen/coproporphyrinogen oxidase n=1 Tax=Streptomyces syringium TaxID=76729 RepID=UPI0034544265